MVIDQLREALERVLEPTAVQVRVHPDDRATIEEVLPSLVAGLEQVQHTTLTEDPAVGRGGCVLKVRGGEIDAAVDTQIRRLTALILPASPGDAPEQPSLPDAEATTDAGPDATPVDPPHPPSAPAGS